MDNKGDYTPDLHPFLPGDGDRRVGRVFREENDLVFFQEKAFHCKFSIPDCNDNLSGTGRDASVYNKDIPRMDPRTDHRVPSCPNKVSGGRVGNKEFPQIEGFLHISLCGGREPCG
jgi:hypothetical protein